MRIVKGVVRISPGFIEVFSDEDVPILRATFEEDSPENATIEVSDPMILGTIGLKREFMFIRVPGVTADTWESRVKLTNKVVERDWRIAPGQETFKESRSDANGYLFQVERWV